MADTEWTYLLLGVVVGAVAAATMMWGRRGSDTGGPTRKRGRDLSGHVHKGGWNDLSRWQDFGGDVPRPPPPARSQPTTLDPDLVKRLDEAAATGLKFSKDLDRRLRRMEGRCPCCR